MLTGQHDEGGAAMAKLLPTQTYGQIVAYGVRMATMGHLTDDPDAERSRVRLEDARLWSRALTISGGSSEVMRDILAKRRLGLTSANRR
jgi:alkylation response protein AidB-like acyl-CoA dehydrogenase